MPSCSRLHFKPVEDCLRQRLPTLSLHTSRSSTDEQMERLRVRASGEYDAEMRSPLNTSPSYASKLPCYRIALPHGNIAEQEIAIAAPLTANVEPSN